MRYARWGIRRMIITGREAALAVDLGSAERAQTRFGERRGMFRLEAGSCRPADKG